ncbi:MAG: MBL fold metallo-hydrolase [Ignavibacteria bacterium]|nr:MBL fold metallo-hydrolase [Ignavibacteria bacterium]
MKIKSFVFSPFDENTFVVFDEVTKETAIVDPGCYSLEEEQELSDFIDENRLKVKYLINTHCHLDHIFGNNFVKRQYNPEYLIPAKDLFLLENAPKMGRAFGIEMEEVTLPDGFYDENYTFKIGRYIFEPIFTPGHTPGEYCLYCAEEKILIAGDVLFAGSIGRTDLWGGDYDILINSIKSKLLTLPDDTVVYPGHGESTTIGKEKATNTFLV